MAPRPLPDESITDLGGPRARFKACLEADGRWRRNALVDLKFRAGTDGERSYQWPEDVQTARNQAGQPFLTINRIDPFLKQVENQARQANITIQVVPLKGDTSEAGAEARQGLIRHVMDLSDGEVVGDLVFKDSLTMGKGWGQVYTDYDDESEDEEQEIYVRAIPDVFSVFADPAASKPDRRDMRFAFVVEDVPREEFDLLYPESKLTMGVVTLASLGTDDRLNWFPGGSVRVADYYSVVEEVTHKKGRPVRRVTAVKHQKITGLEILEETEIPITRIPLVPEFGDEYRISGQTDYQGMVRNGREPQRLFNFCATSLAEQADAANDSAPIIAARQIEGVEKFWSQKRPQYRVYNDTDTQGNPIGAPPPQRYPVPLSPAVVEALQMSDMYLKEVFALFDPSLGQQKSQQSGRAVLALQQQGEIGNFNFIDNHKRFLRSLGRLILEMAAVYYDTPRVRRILGKENAPKQVMFHAGEENAPDLSDQELQEQGIKSVHDLTVGKYDVTVTTGPNYLSQRQQAVAAMVDVGKVAPQTVPVWIDLFFKNSDFPGAIEIYERLKRTISRQFQEPDDQTDQQQQQAQMQQQLQQFAQQHDLLVKELNAKIQYIQTDQAKYQSQQAIKQAEFAFQLELQTLKNAATIAVAEINAQTKGVISANELGHEATALMQTQAHEAASAHVDRLHELRTQQVAHAQALAQGDAGAQNDAALSAQQHGQALEQGDQQAQNTMATQAQASTLQPAPDDGSGGGGAA